MKPVRCFIAVELSSAIRERIATFSEALQGANADVKWVKPENLHLTLKFLGDVKPDKIDPIAEILREICGKTEPFRLSFSGTGCFPNERRPRVLWTGLEEGAKRLTQLAYRIDQSLTQSGFEPEKRGFKPHLTLGRVKSNKNIERVIRLMRQDSHLFGGMDIKEIIFMQSVLKPTGAVYTPLHHIKLQESLWQKRKMKK